MGSGRETRTDGMETFSSHVPAAVAPQAVGYLNIDIVSVLIA